LQEAQVAARNTMSSPIARSLIGSAVAIAVFALGSPARAADDDPLAAPGWRPWLSLGFDIHSQGAEADFASDSVPLLAGGTRSSRASGSTDILVGLISFEAALEAPRLLDSRWVPRPFVHVGAQIPTNASHVILREQGIDGDPADRRVAEHFYQLEFVASWYAGVGAAWTWPVAGRQVSIRPSFDYFGERVDWEGSSVLEERDEFTPPGDEMPIFDVSASASTTYHALGTRLAADVLIGRKGRVGLGLYAQTQFYWILSDREEALGVDNRIGAGSAVITFGKDQFVAQGGVGFRLTWLPR